MRSSKLLLAFLVVVLAVPALAQGTGALTGTVVDPTGAVVPGATITATHLATNVATTTESTASGLYRFPSLAVGIYTVAVQMSGFRVTQVANVVLTVGQTVRRDVTLEVGTVAETVTVEAGGQQLIETESAELSGFIDANTINQVPLAVREPSVFVNLMPGVVDGNTISNAIGTVSRGAAVHGARSGTGNFTVDGFDNNDQGQGGRGGSGGSLGVPGAQVGISPEAIQEFRVVTSNFEAQHGRAGGFVANVTLKSGSNDIHGSAFLYNRVQKLAANSWASNQAGDEDQLVRNQFGGSVGGPIVKDKTFFFSSIEIHRKRTQSPTTVTTVTPAFIEFVRSGQFAAFHESDPNGICMVENAAPCPGAFALSSALGPIVGGLVDQFGFPVPSSNFTNIGAGLLTGGIVYPVDVYGTGTGVSTDPLDQNRFSFKLDHIFSDSDRLSGTWLFDDQDAGGSFGGDYFNPAFPFTNPARFNLIGVNWTHTFSPSLIADLRMGYLRDVSDFPSLLDPEPPTVYTFVGPLTTSLGRTAGLPQFFTNNQFQYSGNITVIHGSHTIQTGGEYRRTRNGSAFEALKNGIFGFNDIESLLTDGAFGDESDLAILGAPTFGAGFVFGAINPQTGQLPEFYRGYRANEFGVYAQDTWKLSSRLTLNFGFRWDYQGPPHNFREGLDSNFFFGPPLPPDPTVQAGWTSCDASVDATDNPFFPCQSTTLQRVANGQFVQKDRNIWAKDTNNIAPRVGFAYDVLGTQKLVIRGGGGFFYDRIWNNLFENIRFNPPFHAFAGTGFFIDGTTVGPLSFPGMFSFPINPTLLFGTSAPSPRHMDENLLLPYIQQYYFGLQYEIAPDYAFHVTYTSTLGRKLTGLVDMNTFPGRTALVGQATRPNTNIGSDNSRTNAFKSNYHGIEFQVLKRFTKGLQFQASYTYSKAIDEISDAFSGKDSLRPTNTFNIALDRGRADFDIAHSFVSSYYYELPFAKENRWLGGWSTSGIATIREGTPFSILCSCDSNADGHFSDRAFLVGGGDISSLINHDVSPADGYLTTTDSSGNDLFTATPLNPSLNLGAWIDGSLGKNILTGPGSINFDAQIAKRFSITETSSVQFQANFFNIFNHPNFLLPNSNITSGSFGSSTNTFGERVIQLALRIDF